MFTGIVQAKGRVAAIERQAMGVRLTVDPAGWAYQAARGESICVGGTCLTVAEAPHRGAPGKAAGGACGGALVFDVIAETLSMTTLGRLEVGSVVNLEPSVTPTQPLGGHFMQGHVDGVGAVVAVEGGDEAHRITIEPPASLMDVVVPKGSIAVDGVSLTLASVTETTFDVALIPTTLDLTTLGGLEAGDAVNLEGDILAKTMVHYMNRVRRGGGDGGAVVTMDLLGRAGFG